MAGWVLSTLLWALFAASIYFVGHLAQLKLTQNYQSFQTVMQGVAQQSILTGQCVDRQEVGSLLPYKQCIETRWGRLAHADSRHAVLQDLGVGSEQLLRAHLHYQAIGQDRHAFMPFLSALPDGLGMKKELAVLSDEGSSASFAAQLARLEGSEQVWGGLLRPARRDFADYASHIRRTDEVWRKQNNSQWLQPWHAHTPTNSVQMVDNQ